jgi:hypothetical protein
MQLRIQQLEKENEELRRRGVSIATDMAVNNGPPSMTVNHTPTAS